MKKINNLFILLTAFLLFATSCGKEGAVGPQGSTGAQGAVGPAGPAGANGQPGSQIYSGTTVPAATTGNVGDFYLDLATGLLYGPKTTAGWGTGFSLVGATGATGATGASGNTILSGTGIPAATVGNTGDYYLDDSDYLLYGPKTATGWGTATSLQGPAGSANVQYSGWNYATNYRDTTIIETAEPNQLRITAMEIADLAAPPLSPDLLNNGLFQIYCMDTEGGVTVYPLPSQFYNDIYGENLYINFIPFPGRFIITESDNQNSGMFGLISSSQYRYIIIPGGQSIAARRFVNLQDYKAVKKFYRIPD